MQETRKDPPGREFLPRHVGIIMDGNGRWAKARSLPRELGHQAGSKVVGNIVRHCKKLGIPAITVYAFSTENWKRPQKEVNALLELLRRFLSNMEEYQRENARLRVLGDPSPLPPDLREAIVKAQEGSKDNTAITVNIALNYGGRAEIVHGARAFAKDCVAGAVKPEDLTEEMFERYLYSAGIPSPDLLIRPGGELRLSNFLLWQCAYTEIYVTDVLWPDFSKEELHRAIASYQRRDRRFGGVKR